LNYYEFHASISKPLDKRLIPWYIQIIGSKNTDTNRGHTMKLTVKNPTRSRKWGFGWSTNVLDTERGWSIPKPTQPDYTGTLKQVQAAIEADRTFASIKSGGTFYSTRWFYDGKAILGAASDFGDSFGDWLTELGFEQETGHTIHNVTLTLAD
jgi:hypothetical protein